MWSATVLGRPLRIDGRGCRSSRSRESHRRPQAVVCASCDGGHQSGTIGEGARRRAAYRSVQRPRAASSRRLGIATRHALRRTASYVDLRAGAKRLGRSGTRRRHEQHTSRPVEVLGRVLDIPPGPSSCRRSGPASTRPRVRNSFALRPPGSHQPSVRFVGRVGVDAESSAGAKPGFPQQPCLPTESLGVSEPS